MDSARFPRTRNYEARCKKLGAPGNVLDVHPSLHHMIGDRRVPIIFVEGIKKADAIITAARSAGVEVLVVAISGVWNFLSGGPIPDMFDIPVDGREVYICFDSDIFRNPDVEDAARRLAQQLTGRGARRIRIAYLPDQADSYKTGADDFLAAGQTYGQLMAMMRPYDPADLAAERLKRGDQLRAMLEDLCSTFWASEWKGMGGHSSCDVFEHGFFRPLAHRPDLPAHQAVGNFAVLVLDHQDGGSTFSREQGTNA